MFERVAHSAGQRAQGGSGCPSGTGSRCASGAGSRCAKGRSAGARQDVAAGERRRGETHGRERADRDSRQGDITRGIGTAVAATSPRRDIGCRGDGGALAADAAIRSLGCRGETGCRATGRRCARFGRATVYGSVQGFGLGSNPEHPHCRATKHAGGTGHGSLRRGADRVETLDQHQ